MFVAELDRLLLSCRLLVFKPEKTTLQVCYMLGGIWYSERTDIELVVWLLYLNGYPGLDDMRLAELLELALKLGDVLVSQFSWSET